MSDNTPALSRLGANKRRGRSIKDKAARVFVTFGGMSVIFAVLLIFVYLGSVVYPLFTSPDVDGEYVGREEAVQQEEKRARGRFGWVINLFSGADEQSAQPYAIESTGKTVYLGTNESGSIAVRIADNGEVLFFNAIAARGYTAESKTVDDAKLIPAGSTIKRFKLSIPDGHSIASVNFLNETTGEMAVGLTNGEIIGIKPVYSVTFVDVKGRVKPVKITDVRLDELFPSFNVGKSASGMAMVISGENRYVTLAGGEQIDIRHYVAEINELTEEPTGDVELNGSVTFKPIVKPDHVFLEPTAKWMYVVSDAGELAFYELNGSGTPVLLEGPVQLTDNGAKLTHARFLNGAQSLLTATDDGRIRQWFATRDPAAGQACTAAGNLEAKVCRPPVDNAAKCEQAQEERSKLCVNAKIWTYPQIRELETSSGKPVTDIAIEFTRKGFVTGDAAGNIDLFYTTSDRHLLTIEAEEGAGPIENIVLSRNAKVMVVEAANNQYETWHIDNEYPEVSLDSLWGKVWYEGYEEPDFVYQSTGSTDDSESKLSLMPLSFGTLKAAFYAMLLALPLAICGALYTAYFMSAGLRQIVKPVVEIMEALPTVIIGFLAGLWLAPFFEVNMLAVFLMLISLPIAIISFGFVWQGMPASVRHRVPDGWDAALLIPWIVFVTWICFVISTPLEALMFSYDNVWDSAAGKTVSQSFSMTEWLSRDIPRVQDGCTAVVSKMMDTCGYTSGLGWEFDQRNSVVVGLAMGFAVIPTIFSIAEDAVFGVPKHLSQGSLALGATQWQTMVRVVLPTASPGIFSAVMIGLGRAVGETMIVLMATGNTAVMDLSPFTGFRTLSANIAVEVPEAEVGSTHYRILFLSGLVLFVITFCFNTIAELVRQRLRKKYTAI